MARNHGAGPSGNRLQDPKHTIASPGRSRWFMAVPAEPDAAISAWSPMFLFDLESSVSATGTSLPMLHFVRGSIQGEGT